MSKIWQDCPKFYFQLALFGDDASVIWAKSMPETVPAGLLPATIHSFNAARSISNALLSGISPPADPPENWTSCGFLPSKNVSIPCASDVIVAKCTDGQLIAGYPMDANGETWLGLFAGGFPPLGTDDICSLLRRIALSCELISGVYADSVSKLEAFWGSLRDFAGLATGTEDSIIMKTMKYIQALGESGVEERVGVWPRRVNKVSPFANCKFNYTESMLRQLQNARPECQALWVAAVCVVSHDGFVLHHEGMTASQASVFAWRYSVLSQSKGINEIFDYEGDVLLRVWYMAGPFGMCVHSSQDASVLQLSASGADLLRLKEQANEILSTIESYLSRT